MRLVRLVVVWLLAAGVAGAEGPSAEAGRALFTGARPFQAGGAPCGACHAPGGAGMALGANLGPELATSLASMDPASLDGLLEALPFPSMTPVYEGKSLTSAERADLAAYLLQAAAQGAPRDAGSFPVAGAAVAVLLFLGLVLASRRRKAPSRARLLARAARFQGGSR